MIYVHPHHGFLNTDFSITCNSPCEVTIELKSLEDPNDSEKTTRNQSTINLCNGEVIHKRFHVPGVYYIKSSMEEYPHIIQVKDAIKFGGSTQKAQFIFENTPWCFVVMKDRTYFYNRDTDKSYVEFVSPDEISYVNEDVVLFSNKYHDGEKDCKEYSLYSLSMQKQIISFGEYVFLDEGELVISEKGNDKENFIIVNLRSSKYTKNILSGDCCSVDSELRKIYVAEDFQVRIFSLDTLEPMGNSCYLHRIIGFTNIRYVITHTSHSKDYTIYVNNIQNSKSIGCITSALPIVSVENKKIAEEPDEEDFVEIPHIFVNNGVVHYIMNNITHYTRKYDDDVNVIKRTREKKLKCCHLGEKEWNVSYISKIFKYGGDFLFESGYDKYFISSSGVNIIQSPYKIHLCKNGYVFSRPNQNNKEEELFVFPNGNPIKKAQGMFEWRYFDEYGIITDTKNNRLLKVDGGNLRERVYHQQEHLSLTFRENRLLYGTNLICYNDKCYFDYSLVLPESWGDISEKANFLIGMSGSHVYIYTRANGSAKYRYCKREILAESLDSSTYKNVLMEDEGHSLLYQKGETFVLMDIDGKEVAEFPNLNFISHVNGYRPIFRVDNSRRRVRIIDPVSHAEINDDYLVNYKFVSPDLKLYADTRLSEYTRIFDKSRGIEITRAEYDAIKQKYEESIFETVEEREQEREKRRKRRIEFMESHPEFFENFNALNKEWIIKDGSVFTCFFIEKRGYAHIYATDTDKKIAEINLGSELWFLNYVSFSYDSRYVAIAGRYPNGTQYGGLFLVYDLDEHRDVIHKDSGYAVWRTAFTQSDVVAAYDSVPYTFVANIKDGTLLNEDEMSVINFRNFLAFSPDGQYMALSRQGYKCYSGEGVSWGHVPSTKVFIHSVAEPKKEIISYDDLADVGVKGAYEGKTVSSVSFTPDNKKIMMTGKDGTVVIRNLHL